MKKTIFSLSLKKNDKTFSALTGSFAGLINGMFGGGGGMVVVPMLGGFLGYEKKSAHATAIMIILPISLVSGFIYGNTYDIKAGVLIPVLLGSVIGGVIGALFLRKFSTGIITVIFYALMCFAGVKTALF